MRRLLPEPPAAVTIADAYDVERPMRGDRPWIGLCMVASIDGSTAVDGTSAKLSNANDTEVLLSLRRLADVIVVGAGTVRAEGYGAPKKPGQRVGVVTNTGSVDVDSELFRSGAGFLIAPTTLQLPDGADVDVVAAGEHAVDLPAAFRRLREVVPDVGFVQVEGGAALNGSMLDADLFDELNITTSPQMVGGTAPRLAASGDDHSRRYRLVHVLVDDESFVFSRWVRR